MGKLEGKVAVITAATSGMALATAKLFVEEGAYVFITGRRKEKLDEAVKLIGRNVTGVQGDAANLADLDRLYDFLLKRDLGAAERALVAIERALNLLAFSPFSCRKALLQKNPRWRELLIPFGHSGYVALFEIEDDHTVTVTAIRYQREEDYH